MNKTVWDLKQRLQQEKITAEKVARSLKQWEQISDDVSTGVSNVSTSSHEWHIRFECQYQYNKTLMQQVQRMRAEIRMLRNGNEIPESLDMLKNLRTVGDWRRHIKELSVEKCSLKSLQNMYERQLDSESMVYHRARDDLHTMTKDVRNTFESRIHEQELADRKDIPVIPLTNSPRKRWNKLKPIAHILPFKALNQGKDKTSNNYMNLFRSHHRTEQILTGATFSGLVEMQPDPVPGSIDPIPENSDSIPVDSVPILENSEAIQENSDIIPENPGSMTEISEHILDNPDPLPETLDAR